MISINNLILIVNLDWDEQTDKLYYYRLVATRIQKCRKEAGLHPWDPINAYYSDSKYNLECEEAQEYIEKITRIKLIKYTDQYFFFENKIDELNITFYLGNI